MQLIDPFLAEITRPALAVAREHGFALGGGNALVLHGLVDRPTCDVDLFCDQESGVRDAADLVREALEAAGLNVIEVGDDSDLDDVIYGLADHMIQLDVSRGDHVARMSLSCLPRTQTPVIMDIGPVMHVDDLVAWKVAAIINRREVRDYIDVAEFIATRTPLDLIAMARRVDPGVEHEDIVMVGRVLDRIPDKAFASYGRTGAAIDELRQRFTAWPR